MQAETLAGNHLRFQTARIAAGSPLSLVSARLAFSLKAPDKEANLAAGAHA